jgi:hypothetical protein
VKSEEALTESDINDNELRWSRRVMKAPVKKREQIRSAAYLVTGLLFFAPSLAFATAGLGELDDTAALFLIASVIIGAFLVPVGVNGSWAYAWYFAWLQLPVIVVIVGLAAKRLKKSEPKPRKYFLLLATLYAVLTFTSNIAALFLFKADHSDYFPKEKTIERLIGPADLQKPTEEEIRHKLGEPLSAGLFSTSTSALPEGLTETMKSSNLDSAFILSYYEKCRGREGMEERTYYILLDPDTHRYVTRSAYYGSTAVASKWPHNPFSNNSSNAPLEGSR